MRVQRFAEALIPLSRFKVRLPEDPRGYYYMGLALAESGRGREAAVELAGAVRRDPERLEYRLAAASALARVNQIRPAIDLLKVMEKKDFPERSNPKALWLLADLYFKEQLNRDALRILDRYSRVEPADVRALLRTGQIHLLEGEYPQAVRLFQQAVAGAPGLAVARHGLGLALERANRPSEAMVELEKSVEMDPQNPDFLIDLSKLLMVQGSPERAIVYLKRAAGTRLPPAETYYQLSRALRRAGKREEASLYLEKFQQLEKQRETTRIQNRRIDALLKSARKQLKRGQVKDAHQSLSQLLHLDPEHWIAHSYLAKIYLSSNLLPEAWSHLQKMTELRPESAEGKYLLAAYWYRSGEYRKSLAPAEEARDLRPDDADVRHLLGQVYQALGRPQEALEEFAEAVRLEPSRHEFQRDYRLARRR